MSMVKEPAAGNSPLPDGLPEWLLAQLPEPDHNGLRLTLRLTPLVLPCGVRILVSVQPKGLCDATISDQLLATATLCLPIDSSRKLHPDVRFGNRLELIDEFLSSTWGDSSLKEKGMREHYHHCAGVTWLDALRAAERYLLSEVAKLWVAIAAREAALHSEGEEYFLALRSGLAAWQEEMCRDRDGYSHIQRQS